VNEREGFVRGTLSSAGGIGAAVTAGLVLLGYGPWALAFGIGAVISLGNFWLIAHAVSRLGTADDGSSSRHLWKGAALRFGLVGAVLILVIVVFRVNLVALVTGLLITQAWMACHWLVRSLRADG
jgi:hypothetical protein